MVVNQETVKEKTRTFTGKIKLDATQAKEELKEVENQIDVVTKKYKEFQKLSGRVNLVRDILIFLASVASLFWLFKENIIYAIYYMVLILVIGQAYKR